jgi:hypothetical protein
VSSKKNSPRPPHEPPAARLLPLYRERLAELLRYAEAASPDEPAPLRRAVDEVVDDLNADLLQLYRQAESGRLRPSDRAIVMTTLERLRNILRIRTGRAWPMRDTLHKALTGLTRSA